MNKVKEKLDQILTNQLCILATLRTIGSGNELHSVQLKNIAMRIEETFEVRGGHYDELEDDEEDD